MSRIKFKQVDEISRTTVSQFSIREETFDGFQKIVRECLTVANIRSIFFTIFRKGALLMNMYGFVSMLPANTENHVRTIVVYDWKFREA